ncbi:phosphonate ABC transporter, permease protein PhnE [Halalkalibacter sp. APA_J-10(15)]|uniref:phosphonate ABC transporter, permease protein PhnE n=1 Tax=Halalkalibacter sp. APA_J-10(15) TaxID=2933805 RepID=UPI001FF50763|nr:phosphonate ABC transporter, permease protein PhnE [Halalkalibacter sp. APA_J-10(15)]MCK0471826.1 phosphonate ABC transporter, permease protein PhnE [Halalkalibacter sp. APA_J-10(15)]
MLIIENQLQAEPRNYRYVMIISLIVLLLFVWSLSTVNMQNMSEGGWLIASNILRGLLSPDVGLLFNLTSQGVAYLLIETISIALLGTLLGSILAIPLAFLSASNVVPKPVALLTRIFLIFIRTVPALVYGLMFIRVTGPGPFAGVLTISLVSIGMLAKLYVDAIGNLDTSVFESMTSLGCSTLEKIRYGIIPQLFSIFLSIMIYRFDMNLRDAAVLGLVGAGGIGAPLIFAMNSYRWSEVGSILIGLVILILMVEWFSNRIRAKLVNG